MTNQTESRKSLGGSPAGLNVARLRTLTLAAILFTGGVAAGFGQAQPDAAKPAKAVQEKKPDTPPADKISHGYLVHQSIELGARITSTSGSAAMWDTLVNQEKGAGGRVLGQALELHSVDTSKTPFFDTLTTFSTGYGGDPYDVSRLSVSKGRLYNFAGSFRRDRNYFDYNLLANSLLSTASAATPALVTENDSLHLFNTVRRNTDTMLTLMPLSMVSFRAGFNHGTHEGPAYTTAHDGGDVQLFQWFRNASDTYTGGVDVKLAKRTTLNYDQFYGFYKGDSNYQIAGNVYPTLGGGGITESLGVDTLATATCGTGANTTAEVVNGVANPYCSGTIAQSQSAPTRTSFPTEQFRFSSHYWDRVSMNGRVLYSGATGNVNNYSNTFNGLNTRVELRTASTAGALPGGHFADTKRVNMNADYGIEAEIDKHLSVSDAFDYWNFRASGNTSYALTEQTGTAATSILSANGLTTTTTTTTASSLLNQKIYSNTALLMATIVPQFKLSGGWRYKTREIVDPGDDLTWHENWLLLGAVVQPSHLFRVNVNYDQMRSKSATAATITNTFTREAPDESYHIRVRATVKPAKWIDFAVTGNDYSAKNDDPFVNHLEHNHDFSFGASIHPNDQLSLDFNYAYDDVYSKTDLCYIFTATAAHPLPPGAANSGTCVNTAANPDGSPSLYLGAGRYDAPANFFSGSFNYAPAKNVRLNGGVRLNNVNGSAEELNPLMVPGALQSHYLTPFADAEYKLAQQWAWHGNWTRSQYTEQGPQGLLAPRNTTGDVVTLGVKYAY
ncbi:MAG: hypothetical protein ABSD44_07505 [Terracidiphilus sp.]